MSFSTYVVNTRNSDPDLSFIKIILNYKNDYGFETRELPKMCGLWANPMHHTSPFAEAGHPDKFNKVKEISVIMNFTKSEYKQFGESNLNLYQRPLTKFKMSFDMVVPNDPAFDLEQGVSGPDNFIEFGPVMDGESEIGDQDVVIHGLEIDTVVNNEIPNIDLGNTEEPSEILEDQDSIGNETNDEVSPTLPNEGDNGAGNAVEASDESEIHEQNWKIMQNSCKNTQSNICSAFCADSYCVCPGNFTLKNPNSGQCIRNDEDYSTNNLDIFDMISSLTQEMALPKLHSGIECNIFQNGKNAKNS